MAKKKSKKSATPSGTSISRSYGNFTCSWKPSYGDKVQWYYKVKTGSSWPKTPKTPTTLSKKTTSKTMGPYDRANYNPIKQTFLRAVTFNVRGDSSDTKKIKYTMSNWSGWKTYTLAAPFTPSITMERISATKTTFTGTVNRHINNGANWATYVQFATILRIDKDDTDAPNKVSWTYDPEASSDEKWSYTPWNSRPIYDTVTKSDTTTWTYTIDEPNTAKIANAKNAVRWVGFRVGGPAGNSAWVYAKVAYGAPYPAEITKATVKRNGQKSLDCSVEWKYKHSLSFPIDNMTVQYAIASPGGIYTEYIHTEDSEVVSGKSYYTLTPTYVINPIPDDVANYYNKVESEYFLTSDEEPEEGKTYYTVSPVASPSQESLDNYYINIEDTYIKTTDVEVDTAKTYYTVSAVAVPIQASMDTYYEKTESYYVKTKDIIIDKFKKYYTVVASPVVSPSDVNLYLYYELESTNYIGPVSPSWQDAVIGGDNTITTSGVENKELKEETAKISFKIDSEMPTDQILYVRVNTNHDNKITNGAYYMCTDDEEGTIADKDVLLTEPSFSNPVTPGSNNFISFSVTNNSEASGVYIAVVFLPPENSDNDNSKIIGVLKPNQNGEANATIEIPPEYSTQNYGIGVYAFIGQYALTSRITSDSLGYNLYLVTPIIRSKLVTYGGEIPLPATNVQANHLGNGNVLVTWDWNWKEADTAEIAWSDYADALDSTEQPSTYEVPNSKTNKLIVRNLEQGKTWYFWVRLHKEENTSVWSNPAFESLSSSPSIPTLSLSKRYINPGEKFNVNWTYVSTDNTKQQSATICLCDIDINNTVTHGNVIAQIPNDEITDPETQYLVLDPNKLGWEAGDNYNLAVSVTSSSGMISEDWSEPAPISIIEPIEISSIESSLSPAALEYDSTATYEVDDYVLKRIDNTLSLYKCVSAISNAEEWDESHWTMDEDNSCQKLTTLSPEMTVSAIASGDSEVSIIIERSRDYYVDRPDESVYGGYTGEVVAQITENNDGTFSISQEDLMGYLDDGAYYNYIVRATDAYGQTSEVKCEFVVDWSHQALMPNASISVDNEYIVPKIYIGEPEDIPAGDDITDDVCDIYRKSSDGYVMLYQGAEFDETYVDPYPTIGEHGGYRIVYRTKNGDYITEDNEFAWLDFDDDDFIINSAAHIIDFGSDSVELMFNVNIDNNWNKDFQETKYLGGSIQGDWNAGISKSSSISVNVPTSEWDTIEALRKLAAYTGECHVRTRDGSNFLANVDVSERYPYEVYTNPSREIVHLCEYSLSITRLDPIEPDGMSLEDWESTLPEA